MDQDTELAWTPVQYDVAIYRSNDAMEANLPWPTAWAIPRGLGKKPVIEGYAATPRAAHDAALKAFASMLGT